MTVLELITELKKLQPHAEVVTARDPEGNGFSADVHIEVDPDDGTIILVGYDEQYGARKGWC